MIVFEMKLANEFRKKYILLIYKCNMLFFKPTLEQDACLPKRDALESNGGLSHDGTLLSCIDFYFIG
jgi:hypothetical protein